MVPRQPGCSATSKRNVGGFPEAWSGETSIRRSAEKGSPSEAQKRVAWTLLEARQFDFDGMERFCGETHFSEELGVIALGLDFKTLLVCARRVDIATGPGGGL